MSTTIEINKDLDKFDIYRYRPVFYIIPPGGNEASTIDLSNNVTELYVSKNFDETIMPIYIAVLSISTEDAKRIQNLWKYTPAVISLERYKVGSDAESSVETRTELPVFRHVKFDIMSCDGIPANIPDSKENEEARNIPSVQIKMELVPQVSVHIQKKINNDVYHDSTLSEIIAHLTQDNLPEGMDNYKGVMSLSDNDKRYKSLMVPPNSYSNAVRYLDKVFGMYNGRLILFIDADCAYVLSSTKITPFSETSPHTVFIEYFPVTDGSPTSIGAGSAINEEQRCYRVRTLSRIEPTTQSKAMKEVNGEDIRLVNKSQDDYSLTNCKNIPVDIFSDDGANKKLKQSVLWQKYDNPLMMDKVKNSRRESFSTAFAEFDDVDIGAFTPNLKWVVISEEKNAEDVTGNWRLAGVDFKFSKPPGTPESMSVHVTAMIRPATNMQ